MNADWLLTLAYSPWFYLIASALLLLPPMPFSAAVQRSFQSTRRNSFVNAAAVAKTWQNWVDLFRAALGAFLLTQWAVLVKSGAPNAEYRGLAVQAAVLGVVLLPQMVRLRPTVRLLGPLFYLCGLTFSLSGSEGWLQSIFAVAVGWLFAVSGKNLNYQLPAMAVALAVAGYVLGWGLALMLNCALILVPPVISIVVRKKLLFAATLPAST